MIDIKSELMAKLKSVTGRFQRNRDGQFVGYVTIDGEGLDCWLVFDDCGCGVKDPAFLRLSFENPYAQTKEAGTR